MEEGGGGAENTDDIHFSYVADILVEIFYIFKVGRTNWKLFICIWDAVQIYYYQDKWHKGESKVWHSFIIN